MSKKRKRVYKCELCHKAEVKQPGTVCGPCGDDLERDCLIEMYGEEDGNYFADNDIFPGDN